MTGTRTRLPRRPVDGLLLLDKPVGMTSNAALQVVKRLYNARKAGHTGSLDPLASGMLPICLGEATKLSGYLLGAEKVYRVGVRFGQRTDTGDADGTVVEESGRRHLTPAELEPALARLTGTLSQVPPMYSAIKVGGQRLYRLARAGAEVPREPRTIQVYSFTLEDPDPERPVFRVHCSKGTYVRTLVEDLAREVGTLGHVASLRRLAVLPFTDTAMVTLDQLRSGASHAELDRLLLPLDAMIADWPAVTLGPSQVFYLNRGSPVQCARAPASGLVRLYGPGEAFLGIGEMLPDRRVAPKRLLAQRPAGDG